MVADTDAKARDIARGAYRQWRDHMAFLWEWGGLPFPIAAVYPDDFEALEAMGMGVARNAGNRPPLRRRQRRADRHHLFRLRFRVRLAALCRGGALGRAVREGSDAGVPLSRTAAHRRRPSVAAFRVNGAAGRRAQISSDFGVLKRCFSFGRGSNVATVPEPRHLISAL